MAAGDESAYCTFYDAYFDRLFRYLLVVGAGNEEAAQDALQATFTRVVRYIKVFQTEDAFWSWLTVLARTALADQNRKRRHYLAFLDRFTSHVGGGKPTLPQCDAGDHLRELLGRELVLLPADEKDLVERRYFAGESLRDIAVAHQTTEKAIESRLARVRRKLKENVLSELKDESD